MLLRLKWLIMPENEITGSFFRIRQEEPALANLLIETGETGSLVGAYSEIYYPSLNSYS